MMQTVRQTVDENMDAMSHLIKARNVQKSKGPKRTFGVDLTNKVNQQDNARGANHNESGKPSKQTIEESVDKPVLMVVDPPMEERDEDGDVSVSDSSDSENEMESEESMESTQSMRSDCGMDRGGECMTPEAEMRPWDMASKLDDLSVPEYAEDIMRALRGQEESEWDLEQFMDSQKDINARMRTVLVDWLIEVHRKFKLSQAAYFLGINMVDRYLAKRQVNRTNLQLLGCTCLWIASKYHEIYAPEMDDFVYISDNAFSTDELTAMEVEVLKALSFELTVPTVMNYAERYSKVSAHYLGKSREIKIISDLIMYCSEHCVMNYDLAQMAPSLTGAACFVYACLSTKVFAETAIAADGLEQVMGYSLEELVPAMRILDVAVRKAKTSRTKALFKKYCSTKFSNIGKLNFARLNIKFLDN